MVSSILRLSTKYGFLDLRERALSHLMDTHAIKYEQGRFRRPSKSHDDVAILSLARETGSMVLAPSAFLWLSELSVDQLFRLTAAFAAPGDDSNLERDKKALLSIDDLKTCLSGKVALLKECADTIARIVSTDIELCTTVANCYRVRSFFYNSWKDSVVLRDEPLVWLTELMNSIEAKPPREPFFGSEFCSWCRVIMEDRLETETERIWCDIPLMFGLPNWDELHRSAKIEAPDDF